MKIGDVHHIKILAWQGERQARSDAGKPGVSRPVHSKKCPAMLSHNEKIMTIGDSFNIYIYPIHS